jgi:ParB-like chromosome segregation protein Spo0J
MTSGKYKSVPITKLWVDRTERTRKELRSEDIATLAESIGRIGLIHAPVVTREFKLIAGETRWEACKSLGWTHIPIQYQDEADEDTLLAIELEENIKRKDLPWQDQCLGVERYHELRKRTEENWTPAQTGKALGFEADTVFRFLQVAKEMNAGNTRVANADKFSTARGIVARNEERRRDSELVRALGADDTAPKPTEQEYITTGSFLDWCETYSGPKFNLLHCDFPYGVGFDKSDQANSEARGSYEDSPETYWNLVDALGESLDRILLPSAHIMFWFSMKFYAETKAALENMDLVVQDFPLVWMKSDGRGILPDPTRGPRRIYETCFLASRGDRKIISAVNNAYAAPTVGADAIHISEKPEPMLRHFFRMVVDENTALLDPTCGSGSALRAAHLLGAPYIRGLELNPEYAENARVALKRSMNLKKLEAKVV